MITQHMNHRRKRLLAQCDNCGKTFQHVNFGLGEFKTLVNTMKNEGWVIVNNYSKWFHICDDCSSTYKQKVHNSIQYGAVDLQDFLSLKYE
jgi:transcription elongation factor Elf1